MFRANSLFRRCIDSKTVLGPTLADQGAKMTENDPQDGAQIDPKTIKNRCQNRHQKRCENQEGWALNGPGSLGRDLPQGAPGGTSKRS